MTEVLSIRNLTKRFGKLVAVNQLNLSIKTGQVYGLLGPNGSGKTTTLGLILDVVAPSSGTYQWFGGEGTTMDARKKIGSILETPCFFPYLTAVQNLRIVAHIKKYTPSIYVRIAFSTSRSAASAERFLPGAAVDNRFRWQILPAEAPMVQLLRWRRKGDQRCRTTREAPVGALGA